MDISHDNLFGELIGHLEITFPEIQRMRDAVLLACRTRGGSEQVATQLRERQAEFCACVDTLDYVSYCEMFSAYVAYRLGEFNQAIYHARRAAQQFGEMFVWNKALALVGSALGRIRSRGYAMAVQDLEQAIQRMKSCVQYQENLGNYEEGLREKRILRMVEEVLQEIASRRLWSLRRHAASPRLWQAFVHRRARKFGRPSKRYGRPRQAQRLRPLPDTSLFPASSIIVGVQDFVVAGKSEVFVFESQREEDGLIREVEFAGIRHRIYNVRNPGSPVVLYPRVYRWLRVQGNSMNQARLIPIMDGDYALVIDTDLSGIQAQQGDIVVASVGSPASLERAGVIKRYTPDGLKSETDIPAEDVSYPLRQVKIRGIVIAVAKRVPVA